MPEVCESDDCGRQRPCTRGLAHYRSAVATGESTDPSSAPPCLLRLGLLAPSPDGEGLVPVPATVASSLALRPHREEMAARTRLIEELTAAFDVVEQAYSEVTDSRQPRLTLLRGTALIGAAIDAAVGACTTELMTAQPGGGRPAEILENSLRSNIELIERGVCQRTLYQHAVRMHQPTFEYMCTIVEAGGEVRTLDEMFDRLIICDRTVAFIPTSSSYEQEALEIRDPAVVRFLANVFDHAWARGIPATPARDRRPQLVASDLERALARMLITGYTEEKIARDLGMSRRTVADHTSRLSRRLGSTSRAQLGYLIATRGLLGDTPALSPAP
ncbi:LuxR C-terminal-related transcriptional regulator [Streptomyces termitum]|uniref:LuxR C-terminal-related transcriptional regulator n=2 Tax=Streptomyces termitum TaxID=67368 RepID=UPI0033AB0416